MSTARWTLWRQDDHGNRFAVAVSNSGREVKRRLDELVAAGHKQVFWIEPPPVLPAACACGGPGRFCGTSCAVCGRPGHVRQHPAPLPASDCWCDEHYAQVAERCRRCLICGELCFSGEDAFMAWGPGDLGNSRHDVLHWDCFGRWPERERFGRGYVEAWLDPSASDWRAVHAGERAALLLRRSGAEREVALVTAKAPMAVVLPAARWPEFLADPARWARPEPAVHPVHVRALEEAAAEVRERFPTVESLG